MERMNLQGLIFIACSVFLGICNFLPIVKITMDFLGEPEITVAKMLPSVDGIVGLIAAGACVVVMYSGAKLKCALAGVVSGISCGIGLFHRVASIKAVEAATTGITSVMNEISGSTSASTVTFEYSFGFYLYILAIILIIGSGFFYAMSED